MQAGVTNENCGLNGNGADARVSEILQGLESKLNRLVQGLSLLGIGRCSWCKRFFRCSRSGRVIRQRRGIHLFGVHSSLVALPPRTIKLRRAARNRRRSRFLAAQLSQRAHGSWFERARAGSGGEVRATGQLPGVSRNRCLPGRQTLPLLRRAGDSPRHRAEEIPLNLDRRLKVRTWPGRIPPQASFNCILVRLSCGRSNTSSLCPS